MNKKIYNQEIFGVQLKDKNKKLQSQSGGAFTIFAEKILSMSGVIYGVCLNDDMQATYCRVVDIEGLQAIKGSKYVQASVEDNFMKVKKDLIEGRYVLFSGTPCYVDGLLKFLKDSDTSKLYTIDLVCHGVPSPLIYNEYLNYISKGKRNNISKFCFRDKQMGWHSQYESYWLNSKKKMNNIYARLFSAHVCLRECCYSCRYTNFNRVSDITVGDFWGIEKIKPYMDDNTGISLVMINTKNGKDLFDLSKEEMNFFNGSREECKQPQLCYPSKKSKHYNEFWEVYHNKPFKKVVFHYGKGGVKGVIKTKTITFTKKIKIYKLIKTIRKQ